MRRRTLLKIPALAGAARAAVPAPLAPERLTCERLDSPLAIEVAAPRLSWELRDPRPRASQTAYQIRVASSEEKLRLAADLWDSGKVTSGETLDIEYQGKPLASAQRCFWMVRTWDGHGVASPWSKPAFWGIGLLRPDDWTAKWIGDPDPPPPDSPPHLGYRSLPATSGDQPKWVAIDLGREVTFNGVRLYGARTVNRPGSGDVPGYLYPLRYRVEASAHSDFSSPVVLARCDSEDVANPGVQPVTLRFSQAQARFVRLWVTAFRADERQQYAFALAEMEVLRDEENLALGARVFALDSQEDTHWSAAKLTDGDIYWHDGGPVTPMTPPRLRKEERLPAVPQRAVAFTSALGLYELRINGQRVGGQELAPEWTDYDRFVQYQAYDVTSLLRAGANVLAVQLADGWYSGRVGMTQQNRKRLRGVYGRRPRFLLQIQAQFSDGSTRVIATDSTWKSTREGPVRFADLYDGESHDGRREMPGWDRPGPFDDSRWKAVEVEASVVPALRAQANEPVRIQHKITPKTVRRREDGQCIFDLGQNIAGRVRIRLRGKAGTVVRIRHAEVLAPDGGIYAAMLRGAGQTDTYTLRGDAAGEVFEPRFTQHGFRYVEVNGLDYVPAASDLSGLAFYSASAQTGAFECSSPLANQIWQSALWTQRGNSLGILTDCPQRDERLGWLGDMQSFVHTGCFNMNVATLLRKVMRDVRETQRPDGRFPNIAPNVLAFAGGAPAWADGGVLIPWAGYLHFADRRLLEENYAAARRFIDGIRDRSPDFLPKDTGFGDWLNGDRLDLDGYPVSGAQVPQGLFTAAFYYYSTSTVVNMARALGRSEDERQYSSLASSIAQAFRSKFIGPEGKIEGDSQGSYALALYCGLFPEHQRPAAIGHLLRRLREYGGRISTGIMTTRMLMLGLSRNGGNQEAYRLFENRQCPSWGFMIEHGATTIWERWDSVVPGRRLRARGVTERLQVPFTPGFQTTSMNSLNHPALASVGEWMYRVVLGLEPDESAPGYKHFFVRPQPGGSLTWARGGIHSVRGPIQIAWRKTGETFSLDLTVPPNTTATVFVPASAPESVTAAEPKADVRFLRFENGAAVYSVQAGTYRFASA